jgi:hypothetical protein
MKFICILSAARTGSTYLTRLLRSCGDLAAYGEIFGKGRKPGEFVDILRGAAGDEAPDDAATIPWRRNNPGRALDAIKAGTAAGPIAFKIFHMNLRWPLLREQVFSRTDTGFIIQTRRPIESYISLIKAQAYRVPFRNSDTTELKPELDPANFLHWATLTRNWYDFLEENVPGKRPFARLSYEAHLMDRSPNDALATVLNFIEEFGFRRPTVGQAIQSLERNDKEAQFQDRVANWAGFEKELRSKPETAAFLDWSLQA